MSNRDNPKIPLTLFNGMDKLPKQEQQEKLLQLLKQHYTCLQQPVEKNYRQPDGKKRIIYGNQNQQRNHPLTNKQNN